MGARVGAGVDAQPVAIRTTATAKARLGVHGLSMRSSSQSGLANPHLTLYRCPMFNPWFDASAFAKTAKRYHAMLVHRSESP